MSFIFVLIYFAVVAVVGGLAYEVVLRRRIKKHQGFSRQVEDGSLEAMPEKYEKAPTRLTGPIYYIAIIGIGFVVITGLLLVAFGACLVVLIPVNFQ